MKKSKDIDIEQKNNKGKIRISKEVIKILIGVIVREIDGVIDTQGSFFDDIRVLLGINNLSKGIEYRIIDDGFIIEINAIIKDEMQSNIVAQEIRDTVKYRLKHKTGIEVNKVKVNIKKFDYTEPDDPSNRLFPKYKLGNENNIELNSISIEDEKYNKIEELVGIVVREIDGVVDTNGGSFLNALKDILGLKDLSKGVEIERQGERITVNLNIIVDSRKKFIK
ncbi:Asp23/Gls24 family envelope stress response protein [Halanaerobacter jeridensis]|uniref:Alkaline shock family protein YloU n=1 Tax=Halanaerobacter jeridensis TaxID=706427 RepID=A0A939BMF6_9FIRM|nr:Asp23/Gls24 family envelope stress response protein [Halanaerobacter jeridensis]MBM7556310.1 putative alkaline shock family protein YloU [Halanaerobacter jeridensis]